jgi:hypothetical protein
MYVASEEVLNCRQGKALIERELSLVQRIVLETLGFRYDTGDLCLSAVLAVQVVRELGCAQA